MVTVLTVDDSNMMRQMLRMTLTGAGHRVIQAADGAEALILLQQGEPLDLIVTDINMPRLDGFGLIARTRGLPLYRRTPILVLSTESSEDKRERARAAGASGWIVKPFNADELLQAVRVMTTR